MTDNMPATVSEYMDTAMRAIAINDERKMHIDWWTAQKPIHVHLGIAPGSLDWKRLRDAWTNRGRAIVVDSASTNIDRTKVAS